MSHTAIIQRGSLMPKALCITSLAIALLVLLIFLTDLITHFAMGKGVLGGASLLMDIAFLVVGIGLAVMSWLTFREQK
jgi:hypothetical protein